MSDAIFRSSHQDVLAAWDEVIAERDTYNDRLKAQMLAWGFDHTRVYCTNSAWGPPQMLAVAHTGEAPTGWRHDGGRYSGRVVPYRRNKQLAAEFDALRDVPSMRRAFLAVGMPDHCFRGLSVTSPAIVRRDDVVWVHWRDADPVASEQWWTRVKLSEYYAMVENGQDPFPGNTERSQ